MKKGLLWTVILFIAVSLYGCSSPNHSGQMSDAKVKQQGNKAKQYLTNRFNKLNKAFDQKHQAKGYILPDDFDALSGEYNILAASLSVSKRVETNDDGEFKSVRDKINEKLNHLTGSKAIKAKKKATSAKVIYKEAMMDNLHTIQDESDVSQPIINELNSFFDDEDETKSPTEISKDAKDSLYGIETIDMGKLKGANIALDQYRRYFNNQQAEDLQYVLNHFKISLNRQEEVLKQFRDGNGDETTPDESLQVITSNFNKSKEKLKQFENQLGVKYVEEAPY